MKKSILASSIAAAVIGLGAVSSAHAVLGVSADGTGDMLVVPYFSAQGSNATLLTITNTDVVNGKAVKVRFRGAANSDDIYDFQVFLSPGDVWTANVSKGADGRSTLKTTDASCTKPSASVLNSTPFITGRLNPTLTGDALASGTREGYIEIIGMADIPKNRTTGSGIPELKVTSVTDGTNPLYTAIKHKDSKAPCSGTAFTTDLDTANWQVTSAVAKTAAENLGMVPSTGGLAANWTIINTVNAAAWSGAATALMENDPVTQVIYVPQTATAVAAADAAKYTADPLLIPQTAIQSFNASTLLWADGVAASALVTAGNYDLPDLSTSLSAAPAVGIPAIQAQQLQAVLNKAAVGAEFLTDAAINGSTDWVFSMPSRRYSIAMAYNKVGGTDDGRRFNKEMNVAPNAFFGKTSVVGGLICVEGAKPVPYDREENTPASSTEVVVSPSTPGGAQLYCGETSVFSFNNGVGTTAALHASVAVTAVDATYNAGWASLAVGYPVLGGSFMKATNGAQGYGIYQEYRFR